MARKKRLVFRDVPRFRTTCIKARKRDAQGMSVPHTCAFMRVPKVLISARHKALLQWHCYHWLCQIQKVIIYRKLHSGLKVKNQSEKQCYYSLSNRNCNLWQEKMPRREANCVDGYNGNTREKATFPSHCSKNANLPPTKNSPGFPSKFSTIRAVTAADFPPVALRRRRSTWSVAPGLAAAT